MSSPTKFYVISISNSKCLENAQNTAKACRLRKWTKSAAQQWTLEAKEGEPQTFAFKSVSDGRYLVSLRPASPCGGVIGVADQQQYWTLEPGRGPRSWQIKSTSIFYGGKTSVYLNDEWANNNDDNKIQTWVLEPNNPARFTFYLWPVDFSDEGSPDAAVPGTAAGTVEDRAVADKRAQELEEKEAAIAKREAEAGRKAQEQEEREAAIARKEQEAKQKAQEQEEALAKREAALAQRENDQKTAASGQTNGTHDEGKERALRDKEAALAKREAELADRERELNGSAGGLLNGANGTSHGATTTTTDDREQLLAKIADLERLLRTPPGSTLGCKSIALVSAGGVRPAASLKYGWDPHLMSSFEAGKHAISRRREV